MTHCRCPKNVHCLISLNGSDSEDNNINLNIECYIVKHNNTQEHLGVALVPLFVVGFHILNPCGHIVKSSFNVMTEAKI